jgi:hypothetical protein
MRRVTRVAHDGARGLSPDGWLPDRISIGMLIKAFPPDLVDEVVEATGTREQRRRLLSARLMVYFVLALWLFRGRNCGYGQVMAKLADGLYHRCQEEDLVGGQFDPADCDAGAGRRWPNISSLSRGRVKLGPDPIRMLFQQAAGPVGADGAAGVYCCELRVISVDGATTSVPDEEENNAFFGRPSNQFQDRAFPQVRWVAAAESGTGALVGAAFGPYTRGEQSLALDLLPGFGPGMLILADRNFLSWSLSRDVLATGAHILWRAPAGFAPQPVKMLSDGTYLALLNPDRESDGPPITVRVIDYTMHPTAEAGAEESPEVFCLVTSLLNTKRYPALDLARAYPNRWGCETVIGHHETDMGEGQPVLRSKDPAGVAQEMWALFAVYQATRQVAGAAVNTAGVSRERISFPHAPAPVTDTLAAFLPDQADS